MTEFRQTSFTEILRKDIVSAAREILTRYDAPVDRAEADSSTKSGMLDDGLLLLHSTDPEQPLLGLGLYPEGYWGNGHFIRDAYDVQGIIEDYAVAITSDLQLVYDDYLNERDEVILKRQEDLIWYWKFNSTMDSVDEKYRVPIQDFVEDNELFLLSSFYMILQQTLLNSPALESLERSE